MKTIEITYRYDADAAPPRPRPSDAHEARQRLDKGSAAFAVLLAGLAEQTGSARRIIDVDPRDLGLLPGVRAAARVRKHRRGRLRTMCGVYLLETRRIWAPRCGSAECNGLAHPPSELSACGELGDAVIRADRIAMILDGGA